MPSLNFKHEFSTDCGSDLYFDVMARCANDNDRGELMRKVWCGTPWMVETYTGKIENYGRYGQIMEWCRQQFGNEALPIHGVPGEWHSGGATVYGWTWMGFSTEERLERFRAQWVDL